MYSFHFSNMGPSGAKAFLHNSWQNLRLENSALHVSDTGQVGPLLRN